MIPAHLHLAAYPQPCTMICFTDQLFKHAVCSLFISSSPSLTGRRSCSFHSRKNWSVYLNIWSNLVLSKLFSVNAAGKPAMLYLAVWISSTLDFQIGSFLLTGGQPACASNTSMVYTFTNSSPVFQDPFHPKQVWW